MRITQAFRQYGVELLNPQFTYSAISEEPRQVIVSLWEHDFSPGRLSYESGTTYWKGAGKHTFLKHLRLSFEQNIPIRVVVASSDDPREVELGNATRLTNDFEPDFTLVGRVETLEADGFKLTFEHTGQLPIGEDERRRKVSAKYWHVAEAVAALQEPSSLAQIQHWLSQNYGEDDHSDLGANLSFLTVNDANRRHFDKSRKNWHSDSGHPRDRLFRQGKRRSVTYQVFRPEIHGHWDLQRNGVGDWEAVQLPESEIVLAETEALGHAFEHLPPLDSDYDARVWALTAVAQRRGQSTFRDQLLEAYERRCAITGSNAIAVLEAAHICPYRGDHTNRVDNGLLLRADIHTLFDLGLIWVTPEFHIAVAPSLIGIDYEDLDGKFLRLPSAHSLHPNPEHLANHARLAKAKSGLHVTA